MIKTPLRRAALLVAVALSSQLAVANDDAPLVSQIVSFEQESVLNDVQTTDTVVTLSDKHAMNGDKALAWQWKSGASLTLNKHFKYYTPAETYQAMGMRGGSTFSVWVYNEKASDNTMTFAFGEAKSASFDMTLDFTGWRSVGLMFDRDMNGSISSDFTGVHMTVNGDDPQGEVFIDRMMVSADDQRWQWSDYHVKTALELPEIEFSLYQPDVAATEAEIASIDKIRSRFVEFYLPNKVDDAEIAKINQIFDKYDISMEDGTIRGPHIITRMMFHIYHPKHLKAEDKALVDEYVDLRVYSSLMMRIGKAYHRADPKHKQALADKFVVLTKHLIDQGFVKGSSLVTTHHFGYSSRDWYSATLLMSDVLEEHGLLDTMYDALVWYAREFKERGFDMRVTPKSSDMDYYNTLARSQLAVLLMAKTPQDQAMLLRTFSKFISDNISEHPKGYADGIRPDGTAWRHKGNYPAYSFSALEAAAHLAHMFHGTAFEFEDAAKGNLKNALMAARIYANPVIGVGNSGRRPFFNTSVTKIANAYKWLGTTTNDKELLAAYGRITGMTAEEMSKKWGPDMAPEAHPQGAYTFNYAAMGIYRYDDYMVTMKGWNKYVWSSEIYATANRYGRYQSHGSVQISPWGDEADWGYSRTGWDWNRMPGATTIYLPWEMLNAPRKGTTMLKNNLVTNGFVDLQGKYGTFGYVQQNPGNFPEVIDPLFTGYKSVYAFEDRLIYLGSDISSSKDFYKKETTLFQHGWVEKTKQITLNGKTITHYPYETNLKQGDWLIDGMGVGYLIVGDNVGTLRISDQISRHDEKRTVVNGVFATAWLDHGNVVRDGGYEYMAVLNATPEKMAQLKSELNAGNTPYQVVKKDKYAHVLTDKATGATGYVSYGYAHFGDPLVRTIDTSALVMTQEVDGKLNLAVSNPDLNMTNTTRSQPAPVTVTLNGSWQPVEASSHYTVKTAGESTVITVNCVGGKSVQITLEK